MAEVICLETARAERIVSRLGPARYASLTVEGDRIHIDETSLTPNAAKVLAAQLVALAESLEGKS